MNYLLIFKKKLSSGGGGGSTSGGVGVGSGGGGTIEDTIDALIEHVGWVSDRYIAIENELKTNKDNQKKYFAKFMSRFKRFCITI